MHEWVSECVGFNIPVQHIIGRSGDESFQAIDCTDTDSQTTMKKKYTEYKITNANINKLAPIKHKNT